MLVFCRFLQIKISSGRHHTIVFFFLSNNEGKNSEPFNLIWIITLNEFPCIENVGNYCNLKSYKETLFYKPKSWNNYTSILNKFSIPKKKYSFLITVELLLITQRYNVKKFVVTHSNRAQVGRISGESIAGAALMLLITVEAPLLTVQQIYSDTIKIC